MEEKLLKILDTFYDLSEKEEEKALSDILKMANEQADELKQIVKELEQDNLSIVYEALAKDMGKWNDFFLDEAIRIIEKAKETDNPAKVLTYLDEFIYIDPEEFAHSDKLVSILKKELKNPLPAFRYWAMSLITDFSEEGDILTIKILEDFLSDSDWRIRYWSYVYLKEVKEKGRYKLAFSDKIRAKFLDPYSFHK